MLRPQADSGTRVAVERSYPEAEPVEKSEDGAPVRPEAGQA